MEIHKELYFWESCNNVFGQKLQKYAKAVYVI